MPQTLTDDEIAVLMIANGGNSMIPIGRWAEPVRQLAILGFLQPADAFNYLITENGRKFIANYESGTTDEDVQKSFIALTESRETRQSALQSSEQAAHHLMQAGKNAAKLSGTVAEQEIWTIGQSIIYRALELLK